MVTSRISNDGLYQSLQQSGHDFKTLRALGDCYAPSTVAAAVYDGHAAARQLDSEQDIYAPLYRRDLPSIDFSTFILSLSTSALYQMGLVNGPDGAPVAEPDPTLRPGVVSMSSDLVNPTM